MDNNCPIISIIAPVYNVEKYLEKCVDSILAQTFENFELLLVDDGSTDNSGNICDKYAKNDPRIKVIHKQNGGLSDARNAGIDAAIGKYIGFIDSDDFIDEDMFELLYNNLINENADVSVCGVYSYYTNRVNPVYPHKEYFVVDNKEAARLVLEAKKISVNAVNKLYKKEIFNDIRFPLGKLSEDAFIMVKLLAGVEKVVVDTSPKYYYVHREGSITTSEYKERDLNVIEAYTLNRDFIYDKFPDLKTEADFRYYWAHFYVLDKMFLTKNFKKDNNFKKIVKVLRRGLFTVLSNPLTGRNRKIALAGLMINSSIYKIIIKLNYDKKRKLVE